MNSNTRSAVKIPRFWADSFLIIFATETNDAYILLIHVIINPTRYRMLAHPLKLRHNQSPCEESKYSKKILFENIPKLF